MEKVRAGEQVAIRASTWNAFIDAANWVKEAQRNTLGGGVRSGIGGGIVAVKNMEEKAMYRLSALVLTGVLVSYESNADEFLTCPPAFEGHLMTAAREGMPYAILMEPIGPGERVLGVPRFRGSNNEWFTRSYSKTRGRFTYGRVHYDADSGKWVIGTVGADAGWHEGDEPQVGGSVTFKFCRNEDSEVEGSDITLAYYDHIKGDEKYKGFIGEVAVWR